MSFVDPILGRIPRVLVPVQVDALVLRQPTGGFADCRMTAPTAAGGRQQLLPQPFTDQATVRPRGVHLHWALPDALTQTRPTTEPAADGTAPRTNMAPIPDRWLVARFSNGAFPDRRRVRAFVIESSGTTPVVTPLANWHESGVGPEPGKELTALGLGDVAWSAYYDNVVNRLGFHDPLDDNPTGPIAYLVTGWFSQARLDPLSDPTITSLSAFYARLAELGWSLPVNELEQDVLAVDFPAESGSPSEPGPPRDQPAPPGSAALDAPAPGALGPLVGVGTVGDRPPLITDGTWWPQGTMLHGSVVAIGWPDEGFPAAEDGLLGTDLGGPPDPSETRVAFGATATDALGALMVGFLAAAEGVSEETVLSEDRMLEAFQLGMLGEIDHPDGRTRLDARLHADSFGAIDAGRRAGGQPAANDDPGSGDVNRSRPRLFTPNEPAVVVQGLRRSLKHGGDGRFSQDGTLVCRLSGFTVTALSAQVLVKTTPESSDRAMVGPDQLLEAPFAHPDLPPDCAELVRETVLLDPGSARAAALLTSPPVTDEPVGADPATLGVGAVDELTQKFMVEQTVWWALRDPLVNAESLLAHSGLGGTLPSPIAVTPPAASWAPRHLDWEVEVFPSPAGLTEWSLGDLDYSHTHPATVDTAAGHGIRVRGRGLLTGGVAQRAAAAGQDAIELSRLAGGEGVAFGGDTSDIFAPAFNADGTDSTVGTGTQTIAQAFVAALRNMDVMAGTLEGIHARLRGEPTGQWVGSDAPPAPQPDPDAPGLIAGFVRPVRLRLVDTFGQVVDLLNSGPVNPARAEDAFVSRTVAMPGHPGVVTLAPRFASPSRLLLRFVDTVPGPQPAPLEDAAEDVRPVCGYLLPDHLDGALEFFDADGVELGQLLPAFDGSGRAVWEQAPGRPSTAGDLPSDTIADPTLGAIADGLVRWGAHDSRPEVGESALGALLRLIDSTLWSTDPFGHAGDEHTSLLVGHPVVVMRADLRIDVDDPLAPADVPRSPVPVRLGALAHWEDGLLGFFAGRDMTQVRPADPAAAALARPVGPGQGYLGPANQVASFDRTFSADLQPGQVPASPVTHPYVADDATVSVWPGTTLPLALLVVPHAVVNATSGLLPRKDIGLRRQWIAEALAKLAPSFRFGPVLVDPKSIRMPVATELHGAWTWNHRNDVSTWIDQPVVNATDDALMTAEVVEAEEGYLILHPTAPTPDGAVPS